MIYQAYYEIVQIEHDPNPQYTEDDWDKAIQPLVDWITKNKLPKSVLDDELGDWVIEFAGKQDEPIEVNTALTVMASSASSHHDDDDDDKDDSRR